MNLPVPDNLGPAGASLWESMLEVYEFEHEPNTAAILERACRTADTIAKLEEAAADAPLVVKGSTGQPVANPLISEARAQTNTLNQLLKSLNLEKSPAERAALSRARSEAGAKGARSRWNTRK